MERGGESIKNDNIAMNNDCVGNLTDQIQHPCHEADGSGEHDARVLTITADVPHNHEKCTISMES